MLKVEIRPDWILRDTNGVPTALPALLELLLPVSQLGSISKAATARGISYHGLDPEAWLRHVLARISDHLVNRVDEFFRLRCAGQLALPKTSLPLPNGMQTHRSN